MGIPATDDGAAAPKLPSPRVPAPDDGAEFNHVPPSRVPSIDAAAGSIRTRDGPARLAERHVHPESDREPLRQCI
jgi:hypothetical protein